MLSGEKEASGTSAINFDATDSATVDLNSKDSLKSILNNDPNDEVHQLFTQLTSAFSEANQTMSDIEPIFDFLERKISWVEDRISEIEKEQNEFLETEKLKQKFEDSCLIKGSNNGLGSVEKEENAAPPDDTKRQGQET